MNIQDILADKLGWLNGIGIPYRDSQFVLKLLDGSREVVCVLKSFDFPQIGINFTNTSEEKMFFREPTLSIQPVNFRAYLLQGYLAEDIATKESFLNLYKKQFSAGLLSVTQGFTAEIDLVNFIEEEQSKVPIAASEVASKALLAASGINPVIFAGMALDVKDQIDDTRQWQKNKSLTSVFGYDVFPLIQLKGCKLSAPSFSPDPSSNEFTTVSTSIVYNDFQIYY